MATLFDYAILQLRPYVHREDRMNIGVVVFEDNKLDIRVGADERLLRYYELDPKTVEWALSQLREGDDTKLETHLRIERAKQVPGFELTKNGWFLTDTIEDYELRIETLLNEYVRTPKKALKRKRTKKLAAEIASLLKGYNVLSKNVRDINKHKIISNMPIGPSGKLHVDFLLKNSKYHITETIDFRNTESVGDREIKNAALVNVTLRHAKSEFNDLSTRCYLLYAATSIVEKTISPALRIAQEESDDAFNIESRDDRNRYINLILRATGSQLELD